MAESTERLDPHLAWIFETEILNQWDHVTRSLVIMNRVIQGSPDSDAFWFAVDAALGAIGNISKILWPTRNAPAETVARCAAMRAELGVDEDSTFRSRSARDALEHFDERVDRWFRESARRNFADRTIAPASAIVGLDPQDYARHYDPETHVVSVFGTSVDFQALVSEVDALVTVVKERHETAWWDRTEAGPS